MSINLKSVAVLPFVNMSSSIESEYFCDGLTEEIINALAKIKELQVTSRTSSFYFKNKEITTKVIGRELNVATLIEGSVRLSGNQIRITIQFIDAQEDFHFWSETFDRTFEDVFKIQDEISLNIADRLREYVGHLEIDTQLSNPIDVSTQVYKKYLKAHYYLMKLDYDSTIKAFSIYDDIIAEAPNFPNAYLDVNQGYSYLGALGLMPAFEAFQKAQPYLQKALELDVNSSRSQLNLSWIECWQNWDLEKAYKHANKALSVQPTDEIYLTISNFLTVEGKLNSAQNYIDKALQLDPFSAMNIHYKGFLYYLQEKYDKALPYFYKALDLNPILPFPPLYIGECLLLSGKAQEALEYYSQLKGVSENDLTKLGGITLCHAALGNTEACETGIKALETHLSSEMMDKAFTFLILVNVTLGNHNVAIDLVEQAFNNRLPLILLLNPEPVVKPIRNDERFKSFMVKALKDNKNYELKRKYKRALMTDSEIAKYAEDLQQLMQDQKLYLNPDLSLKDVAAYLQLPANYVSYLLNEGLNKNFSEFINRFRLNEFKTRVVLEENENLTIMAIAYDSGFNSKTVFNTFFKKIEGTTPNKYLKDLKGN